MLISCGICLIIEGTFFILSEFCLLLSIPNYSIFLILCKCSKSYRHGIIRPEKVIVLWICVTAWENSTNFLQMYWKLRFPKQRCVFLLHTLGLIYQYFINVVCKCFHRLKWTKNSGLIYKFRCFFVLMWVCC